MLQVLIRAFNGVRAVISGKGGLRVQYGEPAPPNLRALHADSVVGNQHSLQDTWQGLCQHTHS